MYLYILKNSKFPFRIKIGISNNVERRKKEIEESTGGRVTIIAKFRCKNRKEALRKEQFLHDVFNPFNSKTKGSGKWEYFWGLGFASITAILLMAIIEHLLMIILIFAFIFLYSKFGY